MRPGGRGSALVAETHAMQFAARPGRVNEQTIRNEYLSPVRWWQNPIERLRQILTPKLTLKIQADDLACRIDQHRGRKSVYPEPLIDQFVPHVAGGLRECHSFLLQQSAHLDHVAIVVHSQHHELAPTAVLIRLLEIRQLGS